MAVLRRWLVTMLAALTVGAAGCQAPAPPDISPGPTASSPAADLGVAIDDHRADLVNLAAIRAVLVSRRGELVAERYYGSEAGDYQDVWSVTKSVTSTLVGIALQKGQLRSVDQTVSELLPQFRTTMAPASGRVTLRQLLTMTSGWTGDWDPEPTRKKLVERILAHGPSAETGVFEYQDAGIQVIAAVLVRATGKSLLEYAREELFAPLGISSTPAAEPALADAGKPAVTELNRFRWLRDPDGIHGGPYGLALTARDLVKLGELWLNEGEWQGRRLLDAGFVADATHNQVRELDPSRYGYGYLWWDTPLPVHPAYMAQGLYGQMVMVVPDLESVVVVLSQGSGSPDDFDGVRVFDDLRAMVDSVVLPNLR